MRKLLLLMDLFIILKVFVVSWMYIIYVKIYQIIYFKYVHFNVCQFYLNKAIKVVQISVSFTHTVWICLQIPWKIAENNLTQMKAMKSIETLTFQEGKDSEQMVETHQM